MAKKAQQELIGYLSSDNLEFQGFIKGLAFLKPKLKVELQDNRPVAVYNNRLRIVLISKQEDLGNRIFDKLIQGFSFGELPHRVVAGAKLRLKGEQRG